MRNKLSLCGFLIVILALATVFGSPNGYTNARYSSTVKMTGTSNYTGEDAITVPVKFYNSQGEFVSEVTVTMSSDGIYDFTTANCREHCPSLDTMTSFTVYIANQWDSTHEVGNTSQTESVPVDYHKTYTSWADFKLTDAGSYIKIKAWW